MTAALAGASLLLLTGCASDTGEPMPVALVDLVEQPDRYDGEVVVAEGLVRSYDEPLHHWIEDEDVNRVELVPVDAAADHVGAVVRVVGRFTFRDDEGRRIEVDDLEVLEDGAVPS